MASLEKDGDRQDACPTGRRARGKLGSIVPNWATLFLFFYEQPSNEATDRGELRTQASPSSLATTEFDATRKKSNQIKPNQTSFFIFLKCHQKD
jgi:hypothetical protein